MSIKTVTMTPEKAKVLLLNNTHNRPLSKKQIELYSAEMAAGRWRFNGDTIRIDKTGRLLDGQHRLHALINAGIDLEMLVVEGLDKEAFVTIDSGKQRSAAHMLAIAGHPNASAVASVSRYGLCYLRGHNMQQGVGPAAIYDFANKYPDCHQSAKWAMSARDICSPGQLGAVLFLGTRAPGFIKRAIAFAEPLARGEDLKSGDPRLALRNFMLQNKMGKKMHLSKGYSFAIIAHCWNSYIEQRPLVRPKAHMDKDGNQNTILGGPAYGAGEDSIINFKLHGNTRRALAEAHATAEPLQ